MSTPAVTGPADSLASAQPAPSCTLVIFGAGGDLTKRLLMPALYNLSASGLLPDSFKVVGVDREAWDDAAWRNEAGHVMHSFTTDKTAEFYTPTLDEAAWGWIAGRMRYVEGDFTRPETLDRVRESLGEESAIFYLAVAPRFFATVVEGLGRAGLLADGPGHFRRVIVEKPFGSGLPSARALNARILGHAREDQVYRIDHLVVGQFEFGSGLSPLLSASPASALGRNRTLRPAGSGYTARL